MSSSGGGSTIPTISPPPVVVLVDRDDNDSIGSPCDLFDDSDKEVEEETQQQQHLDLEKKKLGFNLPTNDRTKSGQLDTLSVDSYWVGEDEIDEIESEKQADPVNPNYKNVYTKMKMKQQQNNNNSSDNKNGNEKETLTSALPVSISAETCLK
jgi:hypothetical protein